ncbi:hypothetical protein Tco_0035742 [Tanacetum coccineum]
MIHTQCNARYEKLEKETQTKISELEECVRIKDRQHIIRASDDFIIFENLRAQVQELQSENEHLKSKVIDFTTVQNRQVQVKELQSKNEHLKSKVVDFITCQTLQMQVTKLKSENEDLKLSVEKLTKAREIVETTLRKRDEMVFAQCEKIRLLEEQCEPFYEVQSKFDLEKVHDTQDNSEKDLILSLQTQLKETAELVVHFSDEKYFALKEIESLKSRESELNILEKVYETKESVLLKDIDQMNSQVSELVEKLKISAQEMKQQIVMFEEDKRMFLAKNKFLEKMSSSMQKEYNDLLVSNDVLKHRLETKFKFLK